MNPLIFEVTTSTRLMNLIFFVINVQIITEVFEFFLRVERFLDP
jgi:hypothetical protein